MPKVPNTKQNTFCSIVVGNSFIVDGDKKKFFQAKFFKIQDIYMNKNDGKWTVSLLQLGKTQEVSAPEEEQTIKQFISMIVLDQNDNLMHAAFSLSE